MHGSPPGFSGFLVTLSFILQHAKKRKKKRMRLFMLCARWPEKADALSSILFLKKCVFFFC